MGYKSAYLDVLIHDPLVLQGAEAHAERYAKWFPAYFQDKPRGLSILVDNFIDFVPRVHAGPYAFTYVDFRFEAGNVISLSQPQMPCLGENYINHAS